MRKLILLAALLAAPVASQQRMPPETPTLGFPVLLPDGTRVLISPSLNFEEGQVLAGNGFTVSTAVVAVASGNFLNGQLSNPAGSGVTFVMTSRTMACNIVGGQQPSEYLRYATGAVLPGTPTTVTVNNRRAGGRVSPATFQYSMGTAPMTGTVSSSGFVPTNGERLEIKPIVLVPPGATLNYSIGGAGGGLAAAARCSMTFLFYTVPA